MKALLRRNGNGFEVCVVCDNGDLVKVLGNFAGNLEIEKVYNIVTNYGIKKLILNF